jgi:hypothetical protein|tara:strand:+ start:1301 stop:1564 length:264 start_codon:yes stop_codon:yes gene_type:complete
MPKKTQKKDHKDLEIEMLNKIIDDQQEKIEKQNSIILKQAEVVGDAMVYVSDIEKKKFPSVYTRKTYDESYDDLEKTMDSPDIRKEF